MAKFYYNITYRLKLPTRLRPLKFLIEHFPIHLKFLFMGNMAKFFILIG